MTNALAFRYSTCALLAASAHVVALRAAAQEAPQGRLVTPGSFADDSARLSSITSLEPRSYPLLRSASTFAPRLSGASESLRVVLVRPELYVIRNSALPYSLNDGALWAGRGFNFRVRAGFEIETGPVRFVFAPEFLGAGNSAFELLHWRVVRPMPPGRHPLSSHWHTSPESIDLPIRFGTRTFSGWDLGQSTLDLDFGLITAGVSTENEWWGPGVRNAIVTSTNAAGIPRFFLRTTRPMATRAGTFDVRLFAGGLRESPYFDTTAANDLRSISAFAVTWSPRRAPNVTVGFARAVYAPTTGWGRIPTRLLDVLLRNPGRPNNHFPGDTSAVPGPDQVYSLFGRWAFPGDGLEVYAEWARNELPTSVRDFLTAPNHTQGYTLGLQWARPVGRVGRARVQIEATYLEKSATLRDRPVGTWYTSRAVPQGYTNRGQVIGAAIGPGADSQWLAVDYFAPRWQAGIFASRIRWDGEALYTFPAANWAGVDSRYCSHDTSVLFGVRGALRAFFGLVELSYSVDQRLNVFFHQVSFCGAGTDPLDVRDALNRTVEIRITTP